MTKITLPIFAIVFFFVVAILPLHIFAQTATPTPTPSNTSSQDALKAQIAELEGKISDLKGQEKTLSGQISAMDTQIKLQELRIENTKQQILDVQEDIATTKKKISTLESSINNLVKVLMHRIVATYQTGDISPLQVLATSDNAGDYITKQNYLKLVQAHDKQLIYDTQQAKNDYANQKQIFETKEAKLQALNAELQDYTKQLDAQKQNKQTLLSQTQGSEANYQRLLAAAKAQLEGFSRFSQSQGGGLLSGQTTCDDWGCYYNQRDNQWGGSSLNGTQYTIASDGCLVTSMAMVLTHYGHRTTPSDINGNSGNFASYYPAYLLYTIHVNGVTASRVGASIDSSLANGDPVVVGIRAYGGTHFVVLRSGSGGSYMMNDPYIAGGNNISFNAHYSVGSIFEIDKVVIN
jgi:peptidoglycan hydrolase CwlO-like protein